MNYHRHSIQTLKNKQTSKEELQQANDQMKTSRQQLHHKQSSKLTLGSQFLTATAAASSCGPSYNISIRYFWAVMGDGKWMVIICKRASPAGSHLRMMAFMSGLPSLSRSSTGSLIWSFSNSLAVSSFLKFMTASKTWREENRKHHQTITKAKVLRGQHRSED